MRVLVTGGLGFVGWVVAARLAERGDEVVALTRGPLPAATAPPAGVEVAAADLRDLDALRQVVAGGGFDGACHLGGLARVRDSHADPAAYTEVNTGGTANLLRAVAEVPGPPPRLVLASTAAVLGGAGDGDGPPGPLAEDHPALPASPYGASKLAAERAVAAAAEAGAVGAVTLRAFSVAGAYLGHGDADRTRILPKALAVAAGHAPHVELNGDGSAVRELTHVADLADAFALALDAARPGTHRLYHAGTGDGVTMLDLLAAVERITGRPVPTVRRPPAPEARSVVANPARIRAELGWRPARSSLDRIVGDAWAAVSG